MSKDGWELLLEQANSSCSIYSRCYCSFPTSPFRCVGEGRIYHTKTVTLMRSADIPVGVTKQAEFIDLPANIEVSYPDLYRTLPQ